MMSQESEVKHILEFVECINCQLKDKNLEVKQKVNESFILLFGSDNKNRKNQIEKYVSISAALVKKILSKISLRYYQQLIQNF